MSNLVLKPLRCIYPVLREPKAFQVGGKDDGQKAYSIGVLIPKTDTETIDKIVAFYTKAVNDATNIKAGQKNAILVTASNHKDATNKFSIFKDGDVKNKYRVEMEEKTPLKYQENCFILNTRMPESWNSPLHIVGRDGKSILPSQLESTIVSGYWVKIAVSPYVYNNPAGFGVALRLRGVQFVKIDEIIGSMENPFEALEEEESPTEETTNTGNPFEE